MSLNENGRYQQTQPQIKIQTQPHPLCMVHFNGGSCAGCDVEIAALQSPRYEREMESCGIRLGKNVSYADVLLCTGVVTRQSEQPLRETYAEMGPDTQVIALGTCAVARHIFNNCYNVVGQVDEVLPVNLYILGCPPRPQAILAGLRKLQAASDERVDISGPVGLVNSDAFRFQNRPNNGRGSGGFG